MTRLLSIEDLAVATGSGRPLVRGVSLTLRAGRILALLGESGCGKSLSLLGALDALPPGLRRMSGVVALDGRPCAGRELRGGIVATVLQNPREAFNPLLTLRAHALETLEVRKAEADARLASALAEVGLDDPAVPGLLPGEMSGGMLQRAMIALALIREAPFLIADEPTTDLDPVARARLMDLLAGLRARRGLGMLLVTHDLGVAARLADEVAVMQGGRIVETAPTARLFAAPAHRHTRDLLAAHAMLCADDRPPAKTATVGAVA